MEDSELGECVCGETRLRLFPTAQPLGAPSLVGPSGQRRWRSPGPTWYLLEVLGCGSAGGGGGGGWRVRLPLDGLTRRGGGVTSAAQQGEARKPLGSVCLQTSADVWRQGGENSEIAPPLASRADEASEYMLGSSN